MSAATARVVCFAFSKPLMEAKACARSGSGELLEACLGYTLGCPGELELATSCMDFDNIDHVEVAAHLPSIQCTGLWAFTGPLRYILSYSVPSSHVQWRSEYPSSYVASDKIRNLHRLSSPSKTLARRTLNAYSSSRMYIIGRGVRFQPPTLAIFRLAPRIRGRNTPMKQTTDLGFCLYTQQKVAHFASGAILMSFCVDQMEATG
jgi:hypothetical protein